MPAVDENFAPSPVPAIVLVPIKQEIVFRRTPPHFWSPGGSAIPIVPPSSAEVDPPSSQSSSTLVVPIPAPATSPVPVKREFVFRTEAPSFWSPSGGGRPIAVVSPASV
ncbi:hypothetical protein K438DRAFT_1804588 [Mycena galopus ATCC 62051]|nr:hypothetical protein K438DRAFT_1804588 [Mycena galopus ATCC 62051]